MPRFKWTADAEHLATGATGTASGDVTADDRSRAEELIGRAGAGRGVAVSSSSIELTEVGE